jgi:hypothetical protein
MPEERFALDCILKQIEGDVPVPVTLVLWYEDEPPLMVGFGLSFGLPGAWTSARSTQVTS